MNGKDTYFVAVKVFLEKDGMFLITKDRFDCWDIPGGRIKPNEFDVPLEDIVKRKMREELGEGIEYTLSPKPEIFMRHERQEIAEGNPTVRIFGLGYTAQLIKGEIALGKNHVEMKWVNPKSFNPEEYFTGGWLKGVQEYIHLKK